MADTRRNFITASCFLSLIATVAFVVSMSSDRWVISKAAAISQAADSEIAYGLFQGHFIYRVLATPTTYEIRMTCVFSEGVCAVSCKTNVDARRDEVTLLAQGHRTSPICNGDVSLTDASLDQERSLISAAIYIATILSVCACIVCATGCTLFSLYNICNNPVEPMFAVFGLYIYNGTGAVLASFTMLLWGIHYILSIRENLAFSYVIVGELQPVERGLGYSYWSTLVGLSCHLINIGLLLTRRHLINRDPPPSTIKIDGKVDDSGLLF